MKKIKLAIVGLGRLGKRHAFNLSSRIPGAEIVAACSLVKDELDWAEHTLGITERYTDYSEMLQKTDAEAIFIVSTSAEHCTHICQALEKGFHVFCEKPMGITVQECKKIEVVAAAHPTQVFFVGFVRRFDPSNADAKKKIESGLIGTPFLVRAQTVDMDKYAPFQLDFVKTAGGIFLDMNVHDIDFCRWILGSEFSQVYAVGGSYVHKDFEKLGDADNAIVLCTFANKSMAVIGASRTAFHSHDTHAEITGTKGTLKIGLSPTKNRLEIFDSKGMRSEGVDDFYERFEEGFLLEATTFVQCVRDGRRAPMSAVDGTKATEVAHAITTSFKEKRPIDLL